MPTQQQQLLLNDQPATLQEGDTVALTIAANDLANLQDRQSTYSNEIKLAMTAENKQIFGQAQAVAFTQRTPYTKIPAKYLVNGTEIVSYGYFVLKSAVDTFNGVLYSGLTGFSDAIKTAVRDPLSQIIKSYRDTKLTDLNWSDIPDFTFNRATVAASHTNTNPLFPIIDYGGTLPSGSVAYWQYLRPGVSYQQVFDRVAAYSGYALTGGAAFTAGLSDFMPLSDKTLYDYQGTDYNNTLLPLSIIKNLPDYTVKDLLKDYMSRYFLTPIVDNVRRVIYFMNFDELYINKPKAYNWTGKFVQGGAEDSFVLSNYAQTNNLTWVEDDILINNGEAMLQVNNETLALNKDLLTSIFSASDNVNAFSNHTVASIKKYATPPIPNQFTTIFDLETKPRIVNVQRFPGTYQISDGTSSVNIQGAWIGKFRDWQFYLDNYGNGLQRILNKVRVCSRRVVLNELDVKDFDFRYPVYDARESQYYYVNSIKTWVRGKVCTVELIKL